MIKFVKKLFTKKEKEKEVEKPLDKGRFVLFKNAVGKFMFRYETKELGVLMTSSPYTRKRDAKRAIDTVKERAKDRRLFEMKTAKDKALYFVLNSKNGLVLCTSDTRDFSADIANRISIVNELAPEATVFESIIKND